MPTAPAAQGHEPIALPGDNFYLTDALHHALNPPPPPPPPPPEPVPFPDSVAVIMETDPNAVANLVPLMLHFASVLGPKWPIVLVTSLANWTEPASPAFLRLLREDRIRIHFLPEGTTFPDHASVSVFLTQPWLWEQFESADRVLLFQADSIICSKSAARVDDFAEWDLVGAPISSQYGVGFNGGLSLRNPKIVLELLRDPERNNFARVLAANQANLDNLRATMEAAQGQGQGQGVGVGGDSNMYNEAVEALKQADARIPSWERFEDQWFFVKLGEMPHAKLPPLEVARHFAVETVWEDAPLGYHQPFRWLTAPQKAKVMQWCPEAAMLQVGGSSHFFGSA